MAQMYPPQLPDCVLDDPKFKGEVDTFNALSKLSDEFDIFCNPRPNKGGTPGAYDRVADFIIIHEKKGLLGIEVKGGKIRINEKGDVEQYQYKNGEGDWFTIQPFKQIRAAVITLIASLKSDGANYWITDNLCVIFPHTYRSHITDMPHKLPDGTLWAEELQTLHLVIPKKFQKSVSWKREDYIDLRRRLQSMPLAVRLKQNESKFESKKVWERFLPKQSKLRPAEMDKPLGPTKEIKTKNVINYYPDEVSIETTSDKLSKDNLKWWEIAAAAFAFILTFLFVWHALS